MDTLSRRRGVAGTFWLQILRVGSQLLDRWMGMAKSSQGLAFWSHPTLGDGFENKLPQWSFFTNIPWPRFWTNSSKLITISLEWWLAYKELSQKLLISALARWMPHFQILMFVKPFQMLHCPFHIKGVSAKQTHDPWWVWWQGPRSVLKQNVQKLFLGPWNVQKLLLPIATYCYLLQCSWVTFHHCIAAATTRSEWCSAWCFFGSDIPQWSMSLCSIKLQAMS